MKSCPKCNRTFPDEGQKFCTFDGGLLIAPQTFDPNMTMRATSTDLTAAEKPTSRDLPNPNATLAESSFASTVALPRNTAPTRPPSTGDFAKTVAAQPQAPPPQAPPPPPPTNVGQDQTIALPSPQTGPLTPPPSPVQPPAQASVPPPAAAPVAAAPVTGAPAVTAPPRKSSKLPWVIVGVLLVLLLGGGALAGLFVFVVKPRLAQMQANREVNTPTNTNANTSGNANAEVKPSVETPTPKVDDYVPPLGTTAFQNSNDGLDGKLAEHYFDFSFYYPESWQKDPKSSTSGSSFVKVERRLPPDFTQENVSIGWYTSAGTYDADLPDFPDRVKELSDSLSKAFPEYRKVSQGPTMVNSLKGYEFRWVGLSKGTVQGDIKLWGRVIFLPTGKEGDTSGATIAMFSTSLAPELSSVDDIGVKGEAPVILESFRFGKKD